MKKLALSIDASRCTECYACVVACLDQNDFVSENVALRQVVTFKKWEYPVASISSLPITCFHCGDPPCLMVCPGGAIFKDVDTGIVDIDRDRCVGCHSCELACPFGNPKFAEDRKMVKCDLCNVRMGHDMLPACVLVCPTKAIVAGPFKEISRQKTERSLMKILKSMVK